MDGKIANRKTLYICIIAFVIPFFILSMAFVRLGVYPFGNRQVLVVDAWNQYYPFLVEFCRKWKNGESMLYSWRLGMGGDFVSLIAYYLASPLNFFTVFLPERMLREAFTLFILIKVGLAGSFCAFGLNRMSGKKDWGVTIFSSFYALCGWTIGYYWNIMWLDTFALLPLVACGIYLLIGEKKYKLYTVSLTFSILTNYYMGLMVCIFTAVFFFAQCYARGSRRKEFLVNLKRIVLLSLLSIMMSAIATLPTAVALQNTYKSSIGPGKGLLVRGWLETLSNTLAYLEPARMGGRPYLYSGILCVLFLFVFFRLPRVSKSEKVAGAALVLFVFISTNVKALDYMWHGLHVANSLPYRFTFIFSFLLVMAAYRAYLGVEELKKRDGLFVGIAGMVYFAFIAADRLGRYVKEDSALVLDAFHADGTGIGFVLSWNFLILAACLIITVLLIRKKLDKMHYMTALAVVAALELVPTVFSGVKAIGSSDRSGYPDRYDAVKEMLSEIEAGEREGGFYRVEFMEQYGWNEPVLYGYNGASVFSSTANAAVTELFEKLGLVAWQSANRYHYQNSTPVNNVFLNLKYFVSRGSEAVNREYLTETTQKDDVYVYKNETYLPVGFMVESEMAHFDLEGATPFEVQNNLVKAAAGLKEDVFEALDIVHVGHRNLYVTRSAYGTYCYQPSEDAKQSEKGKFKYNYEMPEDGCAYVFMDLRPENRADNKARVEFEGGSQSYTIYHHGTFFPAGTYKTGDLFSVCSEIEAGKKGNLRIFVSVLNREVFDRAYETLRDETLEITDFTSRSLKGTITAKKDGLMYTSIPYEKGWKAYVDGERAEITLVLDAFMGIMLSEGEHTVELVYSPGHVYLAAFISLLGAAIFAAVCFSPRLTVRIKRRGIWI